MAIYDETLTETVRITRTPNVDQIFTYTDAMTFVDADSQMQRGFPFTLTETVNITPTIVREQAAQAILEELTNLAEALNAQFIAQHIVSETIELTEEQLIGLPVTLTETVNITPSVAYLYGVAIFEQLNLTEAMLGAAKRELTISDVVQMLDSFSQFIGADIYETIGIVETVLRLRKAEASMPEALLLTDTLARGLKLHIEADETIEITPLMALQSIFNPTITETIKISLLYIGPNDGFTTWVVNTATGAVTQYGNYVFNSFSAFGRKYLAASSTGLYELNGDTDEGDDIIAAIKSGWLEIGGSRYSSFKAAYLGFHGSGDVYLKLETGDGNTYVYKVTAKDLETTKVHMGKGLRSRYFSFELYTVGQDFDLNNIEFLPIVNQRRT